MIEFDDFENNNITPEAYFNIQKKVKTPMNGWKVVEVTDAKMMK
jgi:hypothetical protein